ncbi:SRPBCC family protein [Oxalobacteraceae bacterium]|nr:SRPBCC family protein [Oxalobacteraceae bacterium]
MSNNIKFVASYTATADASVEDIWAIWADINNWDKWDSGIEHSAIEANFKAGNSFSLTPRGGEPIQVTLKTVTQGEEFSDEAVLPFGVIRNLHRISKIGKQISLTHEVQAEIAPEASGFFSKEIWPHMQGGLPESVNNIINIVQED